jgi:hypothetical protein
VKAIYSILTGDGTVSSIVSTRVYPMTAPQSATLPYVVQHLIDTQTFPTLNSGGNLYSRRIQLNMYATTVAGLDALVIACRNALKGYAGTIASTNIQGIFLDGETNRLDIPVGGQSIGVYVATQDWKVFHS